MKLFSKKNLFPLLAGGLTLLAIFACGVSTLAWFTAVKYPTKTADVVSGSPEYEIDETTGYKMQGSEIEKYVVGQSETTSNTGSLAHDPFDVPENDGVGYYLVPEVKQQFKYTNAGTTRLSEYDGTNIAYLNATLTGGSRYQIRAYQYDSSGGKTDSKPISFTGFTGLNTLFTWNSTDKCIQISGTGNKSFSIWVDHSAKKLGLELLSGSMDYTFSAASIEANSTPAGGPTRKQAWNDARKTIFFTNNYSWNSDSVYCHYWNDNGDSTTWPGVNMVYANNNDQNQGVFGVTIPGNATKVIFNNNTNNNNNPDDDDQTVTITLGSKNAFYISGGNRKNRTAGEWDNTLSTKTIYFYNYREGAALFTAPYVYTKKVNGSGEIGNAAWPGVEMTQENGFEGRLYSAVVPSVTDTAIFSDNGSDQTGDATINDSNPYYTPDTATTGFWRAAFTLRKLYLFNQAGQNTLFSSTPYAYSWVGDATDAAKSGNHNKTHPGEAMTLESGYEGHLYSIQVPSYLSNIQFNNGTSSTQTSDITIDPSKDYYVPDSLTKGTWYSSLSLPTGADVTYFFYDTTVENGERAYAFGTPYCYYWKDGAASSVVKPSWPGKAMSPVSGTPGLYTIDIPEDFDRCVFNNNNNGKQTVDIILDSDEDSKKYFVADGTTETVGENQRYSVAAYFGVRDAGDIDEEEEGETITYYCYDFDNQLSGGTVSAYPYIDNNPDVFDYYYFPNFNASWPGYAMTANATYTPATGSPQSVRGLYSVTINKVYNHVIFNNGLTKDQAGWLQTSDSASLINKSDAHWEDNVYFILSNVDAGDGTKGGEWSDALNIITLKAKCYMGSGASLVGEIDLGKDYTSLHANYSPDEGLITDAIKHYKDLPKGILYDFTPQAGWYVEDNEGNLTLLPDETGNIHGPTTLVKKLYCTATMNTFYVNTTSVSWSNLNIYAWKDNPNAWNTAGGGNFYNSFIVGSGAQVVSGVYRITLPDSISGFKFTNGSDGAANQTENIFFTNATTFLHIKTDTGGYGNHTTQWLEASSSRAAYGTVTIRYREGSSGSFSSQSMFFGGYSGGGSYGNYFIYEPGLDFGEGNDRELYIDVVSEMMYGDTKTHYLKYTDLDDLTQGKTYSSSGSDGNITLAKGARYTFYINKDKKVSIAQVPSRGNGYYIMKSAGGNTLGFQDSIKMVSRGEGNAVYSGFNISEEDSQFFIRSYIDAVDTLYENISRGEGVTSEDVTWSNGLITFHSTDKYNITITGTTVTISKYVANSFFVLRSPGGGTIKSNNTTMVLEVKFHLKSTNNAPLRVGLSVTNPFSAFLGVGIKVVTEANRLQTSEQECWNVMREEGNYVLSRQSSITSAFDIPAHTPNTAYFYAYIVIDYVEGSTIPENPPSGALSFYLTGKQSDPATSSSATSS